MPEPSARWGLQRSSSAGSSEQIVLSWFIIVQGTFALIHHKVVPPPARRSRVVRHRIVSRHNCVLATHTLARCNCTFGQCLERCDPEEPPSQKEYLTT